MSLTLLSLLALALLLGLAARSLSLGSRRYVSSAVGALVQLVLGLGALALVTYVTAYFLGLVGGFYESLTCKVVTLPACESPLELPAWLRLPEQSVGGVIGILPLLGIYLAKVLQSKAPPFETSANAPFYVRARHRLGHWLTHNAGVVFVLVVELWLAALRGSAEAADRQVRIALGLDQELPAIYLSVARWGAVVLALGLSVVVIYLGVVGRYSRLLFVQAFARLEYGAGLTGLLGALMQMLAGGLVSLWTLLGVALGRAALKTQSALMGLWAVLLIALGRLALKAQSFVQRAWVFLATTLGWLALGVGSLFRPNRRGLEGLLVVACLSAWGVAQATTYVVLMDDTGSERGRLESIRNQILGWADPSPQRALLDLGDRLIVIPVQAPGNLSPTYPAVFSAVYPSSQLERYAFFTTLRDALPTEVDSDPGTGLSDALRAAAVYLGSAQDERVLIVYGNGEDHSPDPVTSEELGTALAGGRVVHLNLGLDARERWSSLYHEAGAETVLLYDYAATQSLQQSELVEALNPAN